MDGQAGATGQAGTPGAPGTSGPSTGTISGSVTVEGGDDSGSPVAGAKIIFQPGDRTATTGDQGDYTIELPPGVYQAVAGADGYAPAGQQDLFVTYGETTSADFALERVRALVASAGKDKWQAGFGQAVILDGSATVTPSGQPLTYAWTQLSGPAVTLSGADTANAGFTTLGLDELTGGDDPVLTLPSRAGILPFSYDDVASTTYTFQLTVTAGGTAGGVQETATVTVQSTVAHPGHGTVPLWSQTYLAAPVQATYAWRCTAVAIDGSETPCDTGVLTGIDQRFPRFVPAAKGAYRLDEVQGATSVTLIAGTYLGARHEDGTGITCQTCHQAEIDVPPGADDPPGTLTRTIPDMFTPWSATAHATNFEKFIDGHDSPAFGVECLTCHTTGFNPDAPAGGFSDLMDTLGWSFPARLTDGNYDAMPGALKSLSSITCESCHGPGSEHVARKPAGVSISYSATDCNQCHAGPGYQRQGLEWKASAHSRFVLDLESDDPALRPFCASCHSSQGFVAWTKSGLSQQPAPTNLAAEPQTCTACHDPHGRPTKADGTPTPRMLRVYDSVDTLVPGLSARQAGAGALCMTCHNSRKTFSLSGQSAPHTPTQTDVLLAKNVETFGQGTYASSPHGAVPQTCVGCHMATDGDGPGARAVGGHTFSMRSGTTENVVACTGCHPGLDTLNRPAYGDFDGDGVVGGIQDEVDGLLAQVGQALGARAGELFAEVGGEAGTVMGVGGKIRILKAYAAGVSDPACDPALGAGWPDSCFAFTSGHIPADTADRQDFLRACWNYLIVRNDNSHGVHNPAFTVEVLQRTYRVVAGQDLPGATRW
jgi:hypothetical protein